MSFVTCIHGRTKAELCMECGDKAEQAPVPQSAEIRRFEGITRHNLNPDMVLQAARNNELKSVTVIGYTEDGEFYFASTEAGGPSVLWDLEKAKQQLLNARIE